MHWRLSLLLALLVLRSAMGTRPARWLQCWYVIHLRSEWWPCHALPPRLYFGQTCVSILVGFSAVRNLGLDKMFKKGAFIHERRFCAMYFGGSPFRLPECTCGCMLIAPSRNWRFFASCVFRHSLEKILEDVQAGVHTLLYNGHGEVLEKEWRRTILHCCFEKIIKIRWFVDCQRSCFLRPLTDANIESRCLCFLLGKSRCRDFLPNSWQDLRFKDLMNLICMFLELGTASY